MNNSKENRREGRGHARPSPWAARSRTVDYLALLTLLLSLASIELFTVGCFQYLDYFRSGVAAESGLVSRDVSLNGEYLDQPAGVVKHREGGVGFDVADPDTTYAYYWVEAKPHGNDMVWKSKDPEVEWLGVADPPNDDKLILRIPKDESKPTRCVALEAWFKEGEAPSWTRTVRVENF